MVTRHRVWPRFAALLLAGAIGCENLEVTNPNAPERERAFSDPATIVASAAGTMKTYVNMRFDYNPSLTLSAMSDNISFSWNNFNARYYSSWTQECAPMRCGWVNSTSSGLGDQVNHFWYGSYSMLSSANDALFAIRVADEPPDLGGDLGRTETLAQLAQGIAHAWIALNYDRGFIVREDTDVLALEFVDRAEIRDAAVEMLESAVTLARANTFTTSSTTFGIPGGPIYSNLQIAKIARTMQAELLALYPRNAAENAQVNWGQVATYASQGISSNVDAAPFHFTVFADAAATGFRPEFLWWGNDYGTTRTDTRVARLLSTTQVDPWPGGAGNPQPVDAQGNPVGGVFGVDARLGDGCFDAGTGAPDLFGYGECAETANSGSDFLWSPTAIFFPARGPEHQSQIGTIRYHCVVGGFPDCPAGEGEFPVFTTWYNDLLWAEGLVRSNGDLSLAADRINNSHVGRGGLPPLSAADGQEVLLRAILYEQELEMMHHGPTMFYNRRRVSGPSIANNVHEAEGPHVLNTLWGQTPRHMPVPARDLELLRLELYSFGGPTDPDGLSAPVDGATGRRVKNVREIYDEIQKISNQGGRQKRRQ